MSSDRGQSGALILGGRLFGSPLVNGALSESDTVMDIDGTSLAGLVVVGDIFTLAGESGSPNHTVTGGPFYLAADNAIASITFSTGIAAGGVADNAAVTFADNVVAEIRSWTIDNAGLDMIEDTVKGDTAKTFRGGLMGWEGSATAWLDYGDTQQAELIDAIATGSPDGTIAGLMFQVATEQFIYGGAELRSFVASSPENGLVPIGFTFKGSDQIAFGWPPEGALDTFTDSDKNLVDHTPDFGFGGWTYSGVASDWIILGNKAVQVPRFVYHFCRSDNDIVDDNFEVFLDYTRSAFTDYSGENVSIYLLADKSNDIALGEGVTVSFTRESAVEMRLQVFRRDSAGNIVQQVTVATGLPIGLGDSIRIGAIVTGLEVQPYTEPAGGGTRTDYSAVTLTADLRDGDHKRIGLSGRAGTNPAVSRAKSDNLTVTIN